MAGFNETEEQNIDDPVWRVFSWCDWVSTPGIQSSSYDSYRWAGLFLFYVLRDMPPKHKTFSYKDQQRAMRAFDRSDHIDMRKPDWTEGKKKR